MYLQTAKSYWFLLNKSFSKYVLANCQKIIDFYQIKISPSITCKLPKNYWLLLNKISPSMYLQTAKKLLTFTE